LNIVDRGEFSSKNNEEKNPRLGENQAVDGGLFKGTILDVKIDLVMTQEMKKRMDIA
jgi:hypothetical protein